MAIKPILLVPGNGESKIALGCELPNRVDAIEARVDGTIDEVRALAADVRLSNDEMRKLATYMRQTSDEVRALAADVRQANADARQANDRTEKQALLFGEQLKRSALVADHTNAMNVRLEKLVELFTLQAQKKRRNQKREPTP